MCINFRRNRKNRGESTIFGLRPDAVFFLDLPPALGQELMARRYSGDERKKDVHERDLAYLEQCYETAQLAARELGWQRIECSAAEAAGEKAFGGGSGAGISINPIAFLVINNGCVKLLQINSNTSAVDSIISLVPEMVDKVSGMVKKEKKSPVEE